MKTIIFIFLSIVYTIPIFAQNWKPTTGIIGFKIKMFGVGIAGSFKGLAATVIFDPTSLSTANINASVESKTVDTDNNLRNRHLREKEAFFNVAKYPTIRIKSTKIEKMGDGFVGYFDLTMKATTKNIKVPFSFVQTGSTGQFKGEFTINRNDWKVGGGTMGMGDEVTATLTLNVSQ